MANPPKPWKAEYAKSSRSSCKTCKSQIEKETLRLGKMVQATQFDGVMPVYSHFLSHFLLQFDVMRIIPFFMFIGKALKTHFIYDVCLLVFRNVGSVFCFKFFGCNACFVPFQVCFFAQRPIVDLLFFHVFLNEIMLFALFILLGDFFFMVHLGNHAVRVAYNVRFVVS